MEAELFTAAVNGDTHVFDVTASSSSSSSSIDDGYFMSKSPTNNSIIHIAAQHGHSKFIHQALILFPALANHKNNNYDTPLHVAAEVGSKETVAVLVTHLSGDVVSNCMEKNKVGDTPVHVALRSRNIGVAEQLLEVVKGHVDIFSTVNDFGETPLHLFIKYCSVRVSSIQRFINEGVFNSEGVHRMRGSESNTTLPNMLRKLVFPCKYAVCLPDKEGLTPILRAASNGDLFFVKHLVRYCPQSVEVCDPMGRTVLHLIKASPQDYSDLQELIALPSINILKDRQDSEGNTAAHIAIRQEDFLKISVLSESRADFTIRNHLGLAAGDLIHEPSPFVHKMEVETLRLLRTEMESELYLAAMEGKTDLFAQSRINGYKYFFSRTPQGSSILHIAVQNDRSAFVEEALNCYPTLILTRDFSGDTPLHIAARFDNPTARLLVHSCKHHVAEAKKNMERPIGINDPWATKNSQGYTPLHEALRTKNTDMALNLILNTEEPTWQCRYKDDPVTPLHILAQHATNSSDKLETIERLVKELSWGIYYRDSDGLTPLMRAARCGCVLVAVVILRSYPQSVDYRDQNGRSFLHYLRLRMHHLNNKEREFSVWICLLILKAPGVDKLKLLQDHKGNTPLHLAIMDQDFDIARLLVEWCTEVESRKEFIILNHEGHSLMDLITQGSYIPLKLKEQVEAAMVGRIMDEKLYEASTKGDGSIFQQRVSLGANIQQDEGNKKGDKDDVTLAGGNNDQNVDLNNDDQDQDFPGRLRDGSNIIHIAVRHGYTKFIEDAVKNFPTLIFQKDSNGDTPLHVAARLKTPAALKFLEFSCKEWWHKVEGNDGLYVGPPPWMVENSNGNTFLHEAARTSNYEVITSVGESTDSEAFAYANNNGETLLHLCARYGTYTATDKLEVIELLVISNSAAAYKHDTDGLTPVLRAAQCGRIRVALLILEYCRQSLEIRDYKGRTILHHLRPSVVELVDDSEDIVQLWEPIFTFSGAAGLRTAQDEDGNTPLHLAIMSQNVTLAKFLMEKCLRSEGKNELTIINNDGHSVFDLLSSQTHTPSLELQGSLTLGKRYMRGKEAIAEKHMDIELYKAAVKGDAQILDRYVREPIDVESGAVKYGDAYFLAQTVDGRNIVHIALRLGFSERAAEFVEKALDHFPSLVLQPDSDGNTPLHLAAMLSNPASVILIERIGDDFIKAREQNKRGVCVPPWRVKNFKGNMPVHEAFQATNPFAAEFLIDIDSDGASYVNDLGETPLHLYAKHGRYSVYGNYGLIFIKLVTNSSSAVYMRDSEGLTPLLRAAKSARYWVVLCILERCPQAAYFRDPSGRTFLHLFPFTGGDSLEFQSDSGLKAARKIFFEIPEADAQRLVVDNEGNTPLHYAIKSGNTTVVEMLARRYLAAKDFPQLLLLENNKGETVMRLLESHDVPIEIVNLFQKRTALMYEGRSSYGIRKADIKDSTNSLSVIAALLATITFAAAFQVPGGFNGNDGAPVLLKKTAFQVFLVSDTFAMCGSMIVIFFLLWVMGCGKTQDSFILLDLSITLLQASFYASLLAFMTGVYVATAHKTQWLAVLVCIICSLVVFITLKKFILFLTRFTIFVIDTFDMVKRSFWETYKKLRDRVHAWRALILQKLQRLRGAN